MSQKLKFSFTSLLMAVIVALSTSFITKKGTPTEKNLAQQWKMWKVEKGGSEVEPNLSRFIISMKKNGTFVITSEYEMTHRGTWSYKNKVLTLNDKVTNRVFKLPVKTIDATHLVIEGYEGEGRTTFMTPVTNKDAIHLNHKEHIIAKKWRIFESTKERNVGSFYEFHEDKTFIYIPAGMTIPASSGKWTLSKDGKVLTLEIKRSKETFALAVDEMHRHALTLRNTETGTTNYMHDEHLTEKDLESSQEEASSKEEIEK